MKKISSIFLLVFLSGCGQTGSVAWLLSSSDSEIRAHYDSYSIRGLCFEWDRSYDSNKIRNQIFDSLERRGEDGYLCHNPQSMRLNRLEGRFRD